MEWGVPRVPALVDHGLGRLVARADLDVLRRGAVVLAEVGAETALSFLNWLHVLAPARVVGWRALGAA
jgi:hypothetical protein